MCDILRSDNFSQSGNEDNRMMGDVKVARVNQRGTGQVAEETELATHEKTGEGGVMNLSHRSGGVETEAKLICASQ